MTRSDLLRRACLFAGHDRDGRILPYVEDYLRELARHATVFYLADGPLASDAARLLESLCAGFWGYPHAKYDFGSWSDLAKTLVGWGDLERFDEILLANDSVFCLRSLDPVFAEMATVDCDAWVLMATDEDNHDRSIPLDEYLAIPTRKIPHFCLGSYFMLFRRPVVNDPAFRAFLDGVEPQPDRTAVCERYEMGLTAWLARSGHRISAYVPIVHRRVAIYDETAFRLLKKGFPLLKPKIFTENPLGLRDLGDWPDVVARYVGNDRIHAYLDQIGFTGDPPAAAPPPRRRFRDAWLPPFFASGPKAIAWLFTPPAITESFRARRDAARRERERRRHPPPPETPRDVVDRRLREVASTPHLVIFFNLAYDTIGGGMLSIDRLVSASKRLAPRSGFEVIVCGVPLVEPTVRYSMFVPSEPMIHFSDVVSSLRPDQVTIHLPEYAIPDFAAQLDDRQRRWLKTRPFLRINVLDQNHDLFPRRSAIERLRDLTDDVTMSTAHPSYTTATVASEYDCPLSPLTPFLPTIAHVPFEAKESIIAISPDPGPSPPDPTRTEILAMLAEKLPDYRGVVVEEMRFDDYEALIGRARFALTFGEGFDGYFVEPTLGGSLAFAVWNDRFFPAELRGCPTVYPSWADLLSRLPGDVRRLESNRERFEELQATTAAAIRRFANDELSLAQLRDLYERRFAHLPDPLRRPRGGAGARIDG